MIIDYESMGQYLKSVRPDFGISVSFSIYERSKFTMNVVFGHFWLSSKDHYSVTNRRRVKPMVSLDRAIIVLPTSTIRSRMSRNT